MQNKKTIIVDFLCIDGVIYLNDEVITRQECICWINKQSIFCVDKKPTFEIQFRNDQDK